MATEEELELLNAELDDALDVHERARLSRALLADPGLRARRDELRELAAALQSVPEVEPPAGFRQAVLAALPHATPAPVKAWWALPALRQAAMVAAVLAAAAVVYSGVDGRGPSTTEIAGTLAVPPTGAAVDSVDIAFGPVRGRARLTRAAGGLALELRLTAGLPVQALVAHAGQTLAVVDVAAPAAAPLVVTLPGLVADGEAVELSFRAEGRELGHTSLRATGGH